MNIEWGAFLIVAITTWVSAVIIVVAYSFGVRLLAVARDEHTHEKLNKAGAYACFGVCGLVVLLGIVLIVPVLSRNILGI